MQERRAALAGFALSLVLFVLALPGLPPVERPCPNPVEVSAREGDTTVVGCKADEGGPIRGPARRLFGLGSRVG